MLCTCHMCSIVLVVVISSASSSTTRGGENTVELEGTVTPHSVDFAVAHAHLPHAAPTHLPMSPTGDENVHQELAGVQPMAQDMIWDGLSNVQAGSPAWRSEPTTSATYPPKIVIGHPTKVLTPVVRAPIIIGVVSEKRGVAKGGGLLWDIAIVKHDRALKHAREIKSSLRVVLFPAAIPSCCSSCGNNMTRCTPFQ
jgi:hypothetical protein